MPGKRFRATKCSGRGVAGLFLSALGACGITERQDAACYDSFRVVFNTSAITLSVGESFRLSANVYECGGAREVVEIIRWRAEDTSVVRVDSVSGTVTAKRIGTTHIMGKGAVVGEIGYIPATVSP